MLAGSSVSTLPPSSQGLNNAVALDFDYREQMIYWTDVTTQGSMIRRMHINGSNVQVRGSAAPPGHPQPLLAHLLRRAAAWRGPGWLRGHRRRGHKPCGVIGQVAAGTFGSTIPT